MPSHRLQRSHHFVVLSLRHHSFGRLSLRTRIQLHALRLVLRDNSLRLCLFGGHIRARFHLELVTSCTSRLPYPGQLDIKSKSLLVDAKINSERDVKLARIRQSGSARSDQLKVESSTYVATKQAEAERIIAENKAQCMELNASAEAEAAKRMVSQRQYNKMMRSLQSMRGLAVNKDVCVSGKNGDNMVAQLLANVQSGAVLGLPSNLS